MINPLPAESIGICAAVIAERAAQENVNTTHSRPVNSKPQNSEQVTVLVTDK